MPSANTQTSARASAIRKRLDNFMAVPSRKVCPQWCIAERWQAKNVLAWFPINELM
jgi:hypothetical protein